MSSAFAQAAARLGARATENLVDPVAVRLAARELAGALGGLSLDDLADLALRRASIGPRIPMRVTLPTWALNLGRGKLQGYLRAAGPDTYDQVLVRLRSILPAHAAVLANPLNRPWYHQQMDLIRARLLAEVGG